MEKKKMAKALMMTAALAVGMALTQSFFNKTQAAREAARCCEGDGEKCSNRMCNEDKQRCHGC